MKQTRSLPPSLPPCLSLPACLPACLPSFLPAFLPAFLSASLPPSLPACLSRYSAVDLLSLRHNSRRGSFAHSPSLPSESQRLEPGLTAAAGGDDSRRLEEGARDGGSEHATAAGGAIDAERLDEGPAGY
eukprot:750975-Hanusia_phi.AAC.3